MSAHERAAAELPPAIIPPDADALPWMRLITGLVALAILALPSGRHVAEWSTRPIPDRTITVAALPPLEPGTPQPSGPEDTSLAFALSAAPPDQSTARARPVLTPVTQGSQVRAKAALHHTRHFASTRRAMAASTRIARARQGLTRAQVVRAYIASREQVAALTGEDSGSAYLMRVAARQRESRSER
jgi:hypothetical protein